MKSYAVMMLVTELVKWSVMVVVVYLSAWQYGEVAGYTQFVPSAGATAPQYFGIITVIIFACSLVVYLPWRLFAIRLRHKYNIMKDERWRPAILGYILMCAIPSFTVIMVAYKSTASTNMSPNSVTILQMVVMGLVVTEWMVKIQQEQFTFELITAMALDFFFAYDVIAFITMAMADADVFQSGWVYACTVFSLVSMCKHIPTQPLSLAERRASVGHVICILASVFCNDLPFFVIRLSTMIIFGFVVSEMIFVFKNIFLVVFNTIQLGVIYHNVHYRAPAAAGVDASQWYVEHGADAGDVDEAVRRATAQRAAAAMNRRNRMVTIVDGVIQHRRAFRHQHVWGGVKVRKAKRAATAAVVAQRRASESDAAVSNASRSALRFGSAATMTVAEANSVSNRTSNEYSL